MRGWEMRRTARKEAGQIVVWCTGAAAPGTY